MTQKVLSTEELKQFQEQQDRTGIIYLSRIPPFMKPNKLRSLLSVHGEIGRIYLKPEDPRISEKRKKLGGSKKKNFTEGWVEFKDKNVARRVTMTLNTQKIGGKKHGFYYEDLWNLKYLPKFKWNHLIEKFAYDKAIKEQRIHTEVTQAKRENQFYMENVEKARLIQTIEERKNKKKRSTSRNQISNTVEKGPLPLKTPWELIKHKFKQRKPIAEEEDQDVKETSGRAQQNPTLSEHVLGKIFGSSISYPT